MDGEKKFRYDGVGYDSLAEMPEDVRVLFEKNGEPSEGCEEEYEDELKGEAGKDLLEEERVREKADRRSGMGRVWRVGIVIAGVVLFGFGLYLVNIWHVVSQRGHSNSLGYPGLFLVVCGYGLILRHPWFRLVALFGLPMLLLIAVPLYMRRFDAPFGNILLAFIVACAVSFVYLLLPPVVRAFKRQPRTTESAMRIARLAPPPRPVPFSLKLALIWGSHAGLLFSMITAIVILFTMVKLKPVLTGVDFSQDPVFLLLLLIPLAFIVVLVVAARLVIKAGKGDIELFENGSLTSARVTKKVAIKAGRSRMFRIYYEYTVNGKTYKAWNDTYSTARLEDEVAEPLIYLPKKPSMGALCDSFPAHIDADGTGNWINRFPLMGYVYCVIPIAVFAAAVYLVMN